MAYLLLPAPDDFLPFVGLLDDVAVCVLCAALLVYFAPISAVDRCRRLETDPLQSSLAQVRHPNEMTGLFVSIGVSSALLVAGGYVVGLVALGAFTSLFIFSEIEKSRTTHGSVEVTASQFPELYELLQRAGGALPPTSVKLYVRQNPVMNASTFGVRAPYPIILHSALVERLEPPELLAIIGHEIGHVVLGHTKLLALVRRAHWIGRLLFHSWSRCAEHSCDGAGWLATGRDTQATASALVKLASGLGRAPDIDAYLKQTRARDDAAGAFVDLFADHPRLKKRVEYIVDLSHGRKATNASGASTDASTTSMAR